MDWTFAGGNKHLLRGDQPTDAASTTSGHSGVRGWSRDHAAMIPFLVGFVPPPADLEKKEKKEAIEGAHCRMPWPVDSIISMPPSPQVSGNKSLCSQRRPVDVLLQGVRRMPHEPWLFPRLPQPMR